MNINSKQPRYMAFVGYFGGTMACVGFGLGFLTGWWFT